MAGFANMDAKEVVLSMTRMAWDDFARLLDSLANLMIRGEIPLEMRAVYQEHAAALHAAAKSVVFVGQQFPDINGRIMAEARTCLEQSEEAIASKEGEGKNAEPLASNAA